MIRALTALALCALGACASPLAPATEDALHALPDAPPEPAHNATTTAKRELGRLLFWDPILSGDRDTSCASCHDPAFGYGDGRARAVGTGGAVVARNTPTVLNTAWNGRRGRTQPRAEDAPMFWDNRARSLETQALGPLHAEHEMRGSLAEEAVGPELARRVAAIPAYTAGFEAAFGTPEVTEARIAAAIAAFERGLSSGRSAFDRYLRGDDGALSLSQKRGLVGFYNAGCGACHGGPMLSDFRLHDLGAGADPEDRGDGRGRFRTPSLRNVLRTAPYMHDGSLSTLDAVFDFYAQIDTARDEDLAGNAAVAGSARDDMRAFFASLNDDDFDARVPPSVPSGLPVGGTRRAGAR